MDPLRAGAIVLRWAADGLGFAALAEFEKGNIVLGMFYFVGYSRSLSFIRLPGSRFGAEEIRCGVGPNPHCKPLKTWNQRLESAIPKTS
jgi:hypothetical protein